MTSVISPKAPKMKKPKKNSNTIVSNNSQNVTVGTLADAQKPDLRKGGKGKGEGNAPKKDRYVYCDFAQIEEEEYDVDYEIDQEGLLQALDESTTMAAAQTVQHQSIPYLQQPPPVLRASGWVRSQRFPTKLYALLSQPQLSSIITWMPHGRGWKVLKPRVFETSVLPGEKTEDLGAFESLGIRVSVFMMTQPRTRRSLNSFAFYTP